eukprot:TRINITY_DN9220_c0_g1_i1.p1 TRINITY_DN9220_c0_g1~~TRINITY_DN9220_c0_g1_i1.p1  ORF type:complete len:524 (+),score=150.34 TRINITY_DN9220_c0_g1_i1:258-1829(+)
MCMEDTPAAAGNVPEGTPPTTPQTPAAESAIGDKMLLLDNAADAEEAPSAAGAPAARQFGIRANCGQVVVHMLLSVLVGMLLRLTIFPQSMMAAELTEATAAPSNATAPEENTGFHPYQTAFLVSFGVTKAVFNLFIGRAADRFGRRVCHLIGWGFGAVLAAVLLSASGSWRVIVLANVALGAMQAVTWSTNIFMVMDILGPTRRAAASAASNAAGYLSSSATAFLAAYLVDAYGYTAAFQGVAVCSAAGLLISLSAKETLPFVTAEAALEGDDDGDEEAAPPRRHPLRATAMHSNNHRVRTIGEEIAEWRNTAWQTTGGNPSAGVNCMVGLAVNMLTGLVWGYLLIWIKNQHLGTFRTALVNAVYSFTKGILLVPSGLLSDALGRRRPMIAAGLALLLVGLAFFAAAGLPGAEETTVFLRLLSGALALGVGTGLIYPVISASVGDHTPPEERATALGVFRFWRDLGYAAGGLLPALLVSSVHSRTSFVATNVAFAGVIGVVLVVYLCVYRERVAREGAAGVE